MYKFRSDEEDLWLKIVNQWVLDGSRITGIFTGYGVETVLLVGRDGGVEQLTFFHDDDNFEESELDSFTNFER